MQKGKIQKRKIPAVNAFDFQIKYGETDINRHWFEIEMHTHNECELYINLSGDVSFLVENSLYPISHGDVIIARPGERHHCVYRSDKPHKFFWILFDCETNKQLFDFLQKGFCDNYISPQGEQREELLELCCKLHEGELSNEEQVYSFFRFFAILKSSKSVVSIPMGNISKELDRIIEYINQNIYNKITVESIAKNLYISQSTLERKFKDILHITPLEFITRKKLNLAAQMLQDGKSVLQAGTSIGYSDNSYFIELFKHYYKLTPYQYKKQLIK